VYAQQQVNELWSTLPAKEAKADQAPAQAARTDTRVTITFDLRAFDPVVPRGRRGDVTAFVPPVHDVLVGMVQALDGCGVTVLGLATPRELAAVVLAAFQPDRAGAIEWVLSMPPAGPPRADLPGWDQAGPAAVHEYREELRHDAGLSVSFVWAQAPRQPVTSAVLAALARPGRFRRRLTLAYVATPAVAAMDAATGQVRRRRLTQALFQLPVLGRAANAQDDADAAAAEQATHEVAAGAGWIAQTVLVTTTVTDDADLPAAVAETEQAAGTCQLRLRRLYELQAAGFHVGLPAGLHLPDLAKEWSR
jgi:hypothetical protein